MLTEDGVFRTQIARSYQPLIAPARYKGARGGRGSAKSHDRADALLRIAAALPTSRGDGLRAVCLREVQKSLKRSSKQLLEDKIKGYGLERLGFHILGTEIRLPGNGVIIFQGMQDHTAESIKSLEGFDVGWFEEAQACSQRSLDLLRPTLRRETPGDPILPFSELWFSWNTRHKDDPVDDFFFGGERPPDSVCVHTTYEDNPWFPDVLRREMEWDRRRDPEKFAHIWLGGYLQRSEARVFNNWTVAEFDTPDDAEFLFGGDWGFSVDPTVLIRCFVEGRRLYVDAEAYEVGCDVDKTPALFDGIDPERPKMARRWPIVADSARPETISYMRRHGYPAVEPARKGPGSVEDGIEFLKNYDIVVHPRCVHTIDELTHFSYKVDKLTQRVLPILADKKNHVIDALRYSVEAIRIAIQGAVESESSQVSTSYDAALIAARQPEQGDVGASGVYAHEMEHYDGGLT